VSLQAANLTLGYGEKIIVKELNLTIPARQITVLVGRNGCGKSTFLRALARLMSPQSGQVYLDGKAIATLPTKEVARRLATLPQTPTAPEGLTVEGLVYHGRYPHQGLFGGFTDKDRAAVRWALEATGMLEFRDRPLQALSGGQRQRAWIAMALAQETEYLLLDEPTTYLDMAHQMEVLDLLQRLNREQQRTIVMVLHDLNHAARYAHHLVALYEGQVVAEGDPNTVLTPGLVRRVFGVEAAIITDPVSGAPLCVPHCLAKFND
jgi:iron complex transport system ATP-binding protein